MNTGKLSAKIAEKNIGKAELAKAVGIDESTLYRKMKQRGETFTIGQMHKIVAVLGLTHNEAIDIFLAENSH